MTESATTDFMAEDFDPAEIATRWLGGFEKALSTGDLVALEQMFATDCWWRDILLMTWDLATARGFGQVRRKFGDRLASTGFRDMTLTAGKPVEVADGVLTAFFDFDTAIAHGRGVLRLMQQDGEWRAWTVLTMMRDLIGHPERRTSVHDAAQEAHNQPVERRESWTEYRERQREFVDREPVVVVIGAGHAGLTAAARLEHLGLPTLVLEKTPRIGDVWRRRYHNLSLHDTKWYSQMPYLPYPDNWPVFAPKELIADWLEAYAWILQLNVWTNSEALRATYDDEAERWTVTVRRDGALREVHPKHIVFATGAFAGSPQVPDVPGLAEFQGLVVHSSDHEGGAGLAGKKVVVVGSGASAHDVAQDAYEMGATVTMVQRGPTYVISSQYGVPALHEALYSESSPPVDEADLISLSFPWHLFLEISPPTVKAVAELDKELLDGLRDAGFALTDGINGSGLFGLSLIRGGGYYIDKGCSRLIIDRKIGLKRGEVARFTRTGVVYSDGSEADADVVVFATGWPNMRDNIRPIVGDEIADRLTTVWGLDEQGEIKGVFRPSGHPRLWFMGGGFQQSRYGSKLLALQIKGVEEGLLKQ